MKEIYSQARKDLEKFKDNYSKILDKKSRAKLHDVDYHLQKQEEEEAEKEIKSKLDFESLQFSYYDGGLYTLHFVVKGQNILVDCHERDLPKEVGIDEDYFDYPQNIADFVKLGEIRDLDELLDL